MKRLSRDLTGTLLAALFIAALAIAAFWIVRPFIAPFIWAGTLAVVTWPVMLKLERLLWSSRKAAIAAMMLLLLLLLVAPLTFAVMTVVTHAGDITAMAQQLSRSAAPSPPHWMTELPFVGERLAQGWRDFVQSGSEGILTRVTPYAGSVSAWLIGRAGNVGYLLIQFLLTLLFAAFIYAKGEAAAATTLSFGARLGGAEGHQLVVLAATSVKRIALAVGLTAAIQSVLAGAGLFAANVPFAGVLTVGLFLLCITQVGMLVLLIPAVLWVYWTGHPVLGTALLVWTLVASLLDNVIRPMLVGHSADLPMLLIFVGVIGGLLAFGLLGIFIGPVILAVAYTVFSTWLRTMPTGVEGEGMRPAKSS